MHRRVSCAELDEIHYNKANSHIELGGNVPVGQVIICFLCKNEDKLFNNFIYF
jgi:hypothetical protein